MSTAPIRSSFSGLEIDNDQDDSRFSIRRELPVGWYPPNGESRTRASIDSVIEIEPGVSRARRIGVRVLGSIAVVCAIVGLWRISESAQARHAILEWGTVGHSADIDQAGRALSQTFR
jgi:hypothetical protein